MTTDVETNDESPVEGSCGVNWNVWTVPPKSERFSTDGWCKMREDDSWGWYNYKSIKSVYSVCSVYCSLGNFSVLSCNAIWCLLSVNCMFCLLACNSLFSILSVNSSFSILSMNSAFAIGCKAKDFQICFGEE